MHIQGVGCRWYCQDEPMLMAGALVLLIDLGILSVIFGIEF